MQTTSPTPTHHFKFSRPTKTHTSFCGSSQYWIDNSSEHTHTRARARAQSESETDRQTETDRQRQTDRDRQTETDRQRQTETDRQRQRGPHVIRIVFVQACQCLFVYWCENSYRRMRTFQDSSMFSPPQTSMPTSYPASCSKYFRSMANAEPTITTPLRDKAIWLVRLHSCAMNVVNA